MQSTNNQYKILGNDKGKFEGNYYLCGKTEYKKANCWSGNKTKIGISLLDKDKNEREAESTIEYLILYVEIDGEIYDMEKPRVF